MNYINGSLPTKLPVFDGNNWNQWPIQMRVLFGAQDVLDLVNDGYVDANMFEKIVDSTTVKVVWGTLVRCYDDDATMKKMKSYGETLSEQVIIVKVMGSLTPQIDYIVVAIKNSKDLNIMRIEEFHISLEAQELRLIERTSEREVEQALKASSKKESKEQSWSEVKKRHGGGFHKSQASNSNEKKYHKGNEKFDKKKQT
ncbi:uncharacterized protein LOC127104394 [Lathyrus oleraceus]|uniref:uncharacterized protein LOC127104394 n=1 Tax=Pisum sativum TaxID=3888 RepID=UPI0021CE8207|nr:uncharacterized protein LOC127104394 [Pisum sativum]